jgi:aspartate/methionine/tyrosine aminotransferase
MVRMTMADMADLADSRPGSYRLENLDALLPPAEHVLRATREAVGDDRHNSYLPLRGLPELREAVAHRIREDYGLDYDPEGEVVITSGAGEAIINSLLTFVDPGDRVLLTNPTYSGMAQRVRLAGAVQSFADLEERRGWHLDLAQAEAAGAGCRAVLYASPGMPTGSVLTLEETEALCEVARTNDGVVLFNTVYDRLVFDGKRVIHPAQLRGMTQRTISIGAVSKNYNMMGWRIGWTAGPRDLVKYLEDVHIFNGIMPNGFAQAGATAALSGDQEWQRALVRGYRRALDIVVRHLESIPGLTFVRPDAGYNLLINISALGVPSTDFCRRLLESTGVALTPMVAWGRDEHGYEHVRLVFSNEPDDRLEEAMQHLGAFVEQNFDARG